MAAYELTKKDVWFGIVKDKAGAMAEKLEELESLKTNFDFLFGRPTKKGEAIFFIAPITGAAQARAARKAGLQKSNEYVNLSLLGPDKRGLSTLISKTLGDAGINMAGISGMAIGKKCRFYIAIPKADSAKAQRLLKKALS
ncbi:MAG: hypothetical protein EOM20_07730 [Spartobacteria bacterium]|nr:hypothetical protein [Spartobacteria bacterium]